MSANIYYFSGTGNSLVVARDISKKINGDLIPISSLVEKDDIKIKPDIVGVVFPVYHQGVPYIVETWKTSIYLGFVLMEIVPGFQ